MGPYPDYRPWAGSWLPEVPTHWATGSFRHFADFTTGWTPPTGDEASYIGSNPWANISDLQTKWLSSTAKQLSDDAVLEQIRSEVGDLLFAFKLSVGAVARVASPMYTNEAIATVRPSEALNLEYAYYALPVFLPMNANTNIYGAPLLNSSLIRAASVALPPIKEQKAIANYLDRETARIDTLVEEQRRLIEMLGGRRRALIGHALVGNWPVVPFVRCMTSQVDYRGATPRKVDAGVQLVTAKNVKPGWIDYQASREFVASEEYEQVMRRGLPRLDDILFTMEAPLGNVALVDRTDIALAQRVIKWTVDRNVAVPRYLVWAVLGPEFQDQLALRATGSTALGIKASKLPELRIPLPRIEEQRRIAAFLDEQTAKIDGLITETERFVDLARERRAALIAAAVTGQIDVREAS